MPQQNLSNPPPASQVADFYSPAWQNWFARIRTRANDSGQIRWDQIDSSGIIFTVNNVISAPVTVPIDTSYTVISYLTIQSDFTVNGNVMVIG